MNGYIGFYNSQTVEIYADTLFEAKKKAVKHFKVRKSQEHRVYVELAEINGKEVIHTPVD